MVCEWKRHGLDPSWCAIGEQNDKPNQNDTYHKELVYNNLKGNIPAKADIEISREAVALRLS